MAAVGAVVAGAFSTPAAAFCGFYVAGADAKLFNNATAVVMMRDGTRTVLAMQNNYQGPPESFAMVVPVPVVLQKENVRTLERAVFDRIDQMAAPRLVEYWEQDPCAEGERDAIGRSGRKLSAPMAAAAEASPGAMGVTIEAQFAVGEYEVVVLSANDSLGLDTWLRQERYKIPDGAEPLLRPYVAAGSKFFVAKVNVEKVHFDKGMATLSPLRFHYDAEAFSLPVRLGLINSSGTQDLIVHILSRQKRYDVANYPNVTIPTNFDVKENARDQFGAFYASLFDETLRAHPRAVVTEYAWQAMSCDPCPGPTLTASDLVTLGADVLPSVMEAPPLPIVRVTLSPEAQRTNAPMQWQLQSQIDPCYRTALASDHKLKGKLELTIARTGARVRGGGEFPPAALAACVERAATEIPAAQRGGVAGTIEVSLESAPNSSVFSDFVLTRLHARYGKDALGEDLVFRAADPIVGGREVRDAAGRLENEAKRSSFNNFQARYAIRHPWKGPATCANAKFGIWGPPPGDRNARPGPKAARDLAFAPRDGIKLASFVAQEVPELGIQPESRSRGSCACTAKGADSSVAPASLTALLGALAYGLRRRVRRQPPPVRPSE
jgi:hypothetical protein